MSRRLTVLAVALTSLALAACSSPTGPDTQNETTCGIYNGTGTRTCG